MLIAQSTGDLVRGVAGAQPGQHRGAQRWVGVELAGLGPAPRGRGHCPGAGHPVALPATVTGDLPADHARVPPDPDSDHHPVCALGDPAGDFLPVPGAENPSPAAGPCSGGCDAQHPGLPSPVQGAYGVARDGSCVAALDRRASAAPDSPLNGQANHGGLPAPVRLAPTRPLHVHPERSTLAR